MRNRNCHSDLAEWTPPVTQRTSSFQLRLQRAADLPVMTEGVDHASDAPFVFVGHGEDLFGSGFQRAGEDGIRIGDGQNNPDRCPLERFGTEVVVLGRFVAEPEFGSINGKTGNHATAVFEAEELDGSEGGAIEVDCTGTVTQAKPRHDRSCDGR